MVSRSQRIFGLWLFRLCQICVKGWRIISKRMQSMLQPIRIPISILRANGVENETAILTIAVNAITVEYCPRSKPMVSISSTRETVT